MSSENANPGTTQRIFRQQALERYLNQRERDVLPGYSRPPVFLILWLLVGLLILAGLLAWLVNVPDYRDGAGGVTETGQVVIFLAPAELSRVKVGQSVRLRLPGSAQPLITTLSSVEQAVFSPFQIRERFGTGINTDRLTRPMAIAYAKLAVSPKLAGSQLTVQIQVGTRPVISLLPLPGWGN